MKPVIVTEGKSDQTLLEWILKTDPRLRGRYMIVVGGGESTAASLARSYLATSEARVALIADANTSDLDEVPKKHWFLSEALGAVAASDRYVVLLAVPAVEGLLFADRKLAESLFDRKLSLEEWAEAQKDPKLMLRKLIQSDTARTSNLSKLEQVLLHHDLTPFLKLPLIQEIEKFVLRDAA